MTGSIDVELVLTTPSGRMRFQEADIQRPASPARATRIRSNAIRPNGPVDRVGCKRLFGISRSRV
jgi:hypothetical protein